LTAPETIVGVYFPTSNIKWNQATKIQLLFSFFVPTICWFPNVRFYLQPPHVGSASSCIGWVERERKENRNSNRRLKYW